jgi:hypothetical protein
MTKAVKNLGVEESFLNIIKGIYDKSRAHIILNREQLKPFPLKSGARQSCPLTLLLFSVVLEFLTRVRQEQKIKGIQIGKEEVNLSLFADDMILYLRDPKNSTKKVLEVINSFSKAAGYKINKQKSVAFLYTNNENTKTSGK